MNTEPEKKEKVLTEVRHPASGAYLPGFQIPFWPYFYHVFLPDRT